MYVGEHEAAEQERGLSVEDSANDANDVDSFDSTDDVNGDD